LLRGVPIAHGRRRAGRRAPLSAADGTYVLGGPVAGTYTLEATLSGVALDPDGWSPPRVRGPDARGAGLAPAGGARLGVGTGPGGGWPAPVRRHHPLQRGDGAHRWGRDL